MSVGDKRGVDASRGRAAISGPRAAHEGVSSPRSLSSTSSAQYILDFAAISREELKDSRIPGKLPCNTSRMTRTKRADRLVVHAPRLDPAPRVATA